MTEDILAVVLDNEHIRITAPNENDPPEISDIKMFMVACLYRRMMDKGFTGDMQEWLDGVEEDDMRRYSGKLAN